MKKKVYFVLSLIVLALLGVSILYYKGYLASNTIKNDQIKKDILSACNVLLHQSKLPYPGGNLVYFTKDGKLVKKTDEFDYVGGRLCGKDFEKLGIYRKDAYNGKYYRYTLSKNGKYFEIAGVVKENDRFQTFLTGNSSFPITRKFDGNGIVSNGDTNDFPYNPRTDGLVAKISNYKISDDGNLKILDENGKSQMITKNNRQDATIFPKQTLVLAGSGSQVKLVFENGDFLDISGYSAVKIKSSETTKDNSQTNIFWLIGKISYEIYNTSNETNVSSPVNNISIRGDILNGLAEIRDGEYFYQYQTNSGGESSFQKGLNKLKDNPDMKPLFVASQGGADLLGTRVNIEDYISLDK